MVEGVREMKKVCGKSGPKGFSCTLENHANSEDRHAGNVHVATGISGIVYEIWEEVKVVKEVIEKKSLYLYDEGIKS